MNHRDLIKELLKLSDEALKEIGKDGLALHRAVAEGYVGGWEVEYTNSILGWNRAGCPQFAKGSFYRLKPCTININGHEVPEPVRNPETAKEYFYPNSCVTPMRMRYSHLTYFHPTLVDRGLVFKSREDCQKYCDAILSFTKEKS